MPWYAVLSVIYPFFSSIYVFLPHSCPITPVRSTHKFRNTCWLCTWSLTYKDQLASVSTCQLNFHLINTSYELLIRLVYLKVWHRLQLCLSMLNFNGFCTSDVKGKDESRNVCRCGNRYISHVNYFAWLSRTIGLPFFLAPSLFCTKEAFHRP
jgi:hypothetical protein